MAVGGWVVTFMLRVRGGAPFPSGITATGFWLGITVGRVVLGFVTGRIGEKLAISVMASPMQCYHRLLMFVIDLSLPGNSLPSLFLAHSVLQRLGGFCRLRRVLVSTSISGCYCCRDGTSSKASSRHCHRFCSSYRRRWSCHIPICRFVPTRSLPLFSG